MTNHVNGGLRPPKGELAMTEQDKVEMQQMIAAVVKPQQPAQPSPFSAPVAPPFSAQSTGFAEIEVDLEVKAADGSAVNLRGKLPHPETITPANLKDILAAYLAAGWPLKFWSPKNPVGKKF
jgi:hypothetical protein